MLLHRINCRLLLLLRPAQSALPCAFTARHLSHEPGFRGASQRKRAS